jgi:hypothetical protein
MKDLIKLATVSLFLVGSISIFCQDTTDAERQALTNQKDILQVKSDILNLQLGMEKAKLDQDKAKIDAAKAAIGSISTSGLPTGQAQLNNVDIQPTIISYAALRNVLGAIYNKLYPSGCPTRLVFKGPGLDDIALLQTYQQMLDWAKEAIAHYSSGPVFNGAVSSRFAPAVGFAAIDAAVALASLFKTDVAMTGVSVTADDNAAKYIFAEITREKCSGASIVDPADYTYPLLQNSALQGRIRTLMADLARAQGVMAGVQADDIPRFQQEISDIGAKLKKIDELNANIVKTRVLLQNADAANRKKLTEQLHGFEAELATYNPSDLRSSLTKARNNLTIARHYVSDVNLYSSKITALLAALAKIDDTGTPFLMRLLRAETLASLVENQQTLALHIIKQGGNNITKKNVFHTAIHYTGGVVVDFELHNVNGAEVAKAGEVDAYDYHDERDRLGNVIQ